MKKDDETPAAAAGANETPNPAPEGARAGAPVDSPVAGEEPGRAADESAGELAALQERFLRLAAEFDNYRKRTERERAEAWTRAQAQLVEKLLEPLDDLHRVADVKPDATSTGALLEGVQMVERKLFRTLEAAGLEPIDAEGRPFDPSVHEALMTADTGDEAEDNSVGMVFQAGYLFKGQLLRPARVQVRKFGG